MSGGEVGFVGDEGEVRTRTKSSEPLVGEASICRRDFDVWRIVVWGAQDLWFSMSLGCLICCRGWGGGYQYLMTSSSLNSWWKGTRSLWRAARRRRRCVLIGSCFEKAELSIFLCLLFLFGNLSFIPG